MKAKLIAIEMAEYVCSDAIQIYEGSSEVPSVQIGRALSEPMGNLSCRPCRNIGSTARW